MDHRGYELKTIGVNPLHLRHQRSMNPHAEKNDLSVWRLRASSSQETAGPALLGS
jgi:hypothetical protein